MPSAAYLAPPGESSARLGKTKKMKNYFCFAEPQPDVAVTMSEAKGGRVPMNGLDRLWPIKYTYMRNSSRVA